MNRRQALQARRGQAYQPSAREIQIPLPLSGIFVLARSAQVSNVYAAELLNLRSNGVSMILRPGISWTGSISSTFQRIPFEFEGASRYIEVMPTKIKSAAVELVRDFAGPVSWDMISGSVIVADGGGPPIRYEGTAFTEQVFTTITGFDPEDFDGVIAHHDRLFFWKTDGPLEFYYGDVGAVQGALVRFPLGRLGNITGSISSMMSLTVDAGHGMNDVLAIFTTTGQMVIYEGLDPGDSADWRLSARISAASPVGPRAYTQVGSDVWMLTKQGVVSVLDSIRGSVMALVSDLSRPIADSIVELVEMGSYDWQLATAGDGTFIVINAVDAAEETALQFFYYTEGKAWATGDAQARDFHNKGGAVDVTGFDGRLGNMQHQAGPETMTARWVSSWLDTGNPNSSIAYVRPIIRARGPLTVRVVTLADNQDTEDDIAESEQTIVLEPEGTGDTVTLDDIIGSDAVGGKFQITLEVTAAWAEIVSLKAAIG